LKQGFPHASSHKVSSGDGYTAWSEKVGLVLIFAFIFAKPS